LRILLDESIPRRFADTLIGFEVRTVQSAGWAGLRTAPLLRRAADDGFRVLITADASIPFQQNLHRFGIAVIVLIGVKRRFEDFAAPVLEALETIRPGDAVQIAAGRRDEIFDRRAGIVTAEAQRARRVSL
jgi:hypothetical protein